MTTIIMRTTLAHPDYGCAGPGVSITVDDDTAKALIAGRFADLAQGHTAPPAAVSSTRESAAMSQPDTAVHSKPARKPR